MLIPLLNFSLDGREERGDLNNNVSEHIVQLVGLKLIPGLIFMLQFLHRWFGLVFFNSGIDRLMLSGVCFTRLLFNKFQRCVLSSSMQVTRMTFFLLLFPRCVSEGTLQHEVPLRSPIRSDLCARCVPFVTRPAIQKNSQRVVAASRQDNKGKFAFEIIFDYSKSHLMAMSNDFRSKTAFKCYLLLL